MYICATTIEIYDMEKDHINVVSRVHSSEWKRVAIIYGKSYMIEDIVSSA